MREELINDTLDQKLSLKSLQLNTLLEVTEAINNNLSAEHLYKIFYFTLASNLSIKKFALYVKEADWECKASFGTTQSLDDLKLPETILKHKEVGELHTLDLPFDFSEFKTVIPVKHKSNILAYVLLPEHEDLNFLTALANILIVAIENRKLAKKQLEQEALRKEMEIARDVQNYLIPERLPETEALSMAAAYLPHYEIGGDYFDYIPIDEDRYLMTIADVSGKGIPAAILMSNFQASLKTLIKIDSDLQKIISQLNVRILEVARGENFITLFVAIFNKKTRRLTYINAGHNPQLLYCFKTDEVLLLDKGCTVLGAFDTLPFLSEYHLDNLGAFLLFSYTDGVTECRNKAGEEFGFERLKEFIIEHKHMDINKIKEELLLALGDFSQGVPFFDDITFLISTIK